MAPHYEDSGVIIVAAHNENTARVVLLQSRLEKVAYSAVQLAI